MASARRVLALAVVLARPAVGHGQTTYYSVHEWHKAPECTTPVSATYEWLGQLDPSVCAAVVEADCALDGGVAGFGWRSAYCTESLFASDFSFTPGHTFLGVATYVNGLCGGAIQSVTYYEAGRCFYRDDGEWPYAVGSVLGSMYYIFRCKDMTCANCDLALQSGTVGECSDGQGAFLTGLLPALLPYTLPPTDPPTDPPTTPPLTSAPPPTSTVPAGPTVTVYTAGYPILTDRPVQGSVSATKNCYALGDGTIRSGWRLQDYGLPVRAIASIAIDPDRPIVGADHVHVSRLLPLSTAA